MIVREKAYGKWAALQGGRRASHEESEVEYLHARQKWLFELQLRSEECWKQRVVLNRHEVADSGRINQCHDSLISNWRVAYRSRGWR